ncbi:MAG: PHB depolymerase family esterase [Sphingomonadaceae bacterium]|nr:PHB depolymerase family esterase [Sphingomonadaceae bacterium]
MLQRTTESDLPMPRPARTRPGPVDDRLSDLTAAFVNPGALRMRTFVPGALPAGAPLVVVLHGCTQTAAGYDRAAGWSALATRLGFALLFPEQVPANNPNRCFTWFEAADTRRGSGEVASIAAAVGAMVRLHRLDGARVFVTGLSAGGAMANALLAAYPDVFAGGAIIAGLPVGSAAGVAEALTAMAQPAALTGPALGDRVRGASGFAGPWPRVAVWHGGDDRTVSRLNGLAVAEQWADVHGATRHGDGDRIVWRNAVGVPVVEFNEVRGMGHGTPIDSRVGDAPAPFMLDVGIASSARIAAFWGLGDAPATAVPRPARHAPAAARPSRPARPTPARAAKPLDIGRMIGDAMRAAGLMK